MTFLPNENVKLHNAQDENLHIKITGQNRRRLRDGERLQLT